MEELYNQTYSTRGHHSLHDFQITRRVAGEVAWALSWKEIRELLADGETLRSHWIYVDSSDSEASGTVEEFIRTAVGEHLDHQMREVLRTR